MVEKMIKCSRCNKEFEESFSFCPFCGCLAAESKGEEGSALFQAIPTALEPEDLLVHTENAAEPAKVEKNVDALKQNESAPQKESSQKKTDSEGVKKPTSQSKMNAKAPAKPVKKKKNNKEKKIIIVFIIFLVIATVIIGIMAKTVLDDSHQEVSTAPGVSFVSTASLDGTRAEGDASIENEESAAAKPNGTQPQAPQKPESTASQNKPSPGTTASKTTSQATTPGTTKPSTAKPPLTTEKPGTTKPPVTVDIDEPTFNDPWEEVYPTVPETTEGEGVEW